MTSFKTPKSSASSPSSKTTKNIEPRKSGWRISGEVRDMKMMNIGENSAVIVARNNANVLVKVWRKPVE